MEIDSPLGSVVVKRCGPELEEAARMRDGYGTVFMPTAGQGGQFASDRHGHRRLEDRTCEGDLHNRAQGRMRSNCRLFLAL
jgi:hypothetical protein